MESRRLGNSDLQISVLGIGAWAIGGGGWVGSMGPQNEADSIPVIHVALDRGMNWIDTAALYGVGHSEEVVGASLKAESIRRECEASLRRLKIDVIDRYQIHWPEPDEDIEEGWTEMARLKEEGKVRYIGVSNFNV